MRRLLCGVMMVCVLVLGVASVSSAAGMKLGILPVIDTLPLQVAAQEGLFKAEGLDVELVPFNSALERDTAMRSGQLDGYFGDILSALVLIQAGQKVRIATTSYATNPGQPMFAMVTAKGADLSKPLKTGYSATTIIEYLLDRMVTLPEIKDLTIERTEVKKVPIRLQMLLAGQLDAAVLPEPLVSLAVSKGASVAVTDETLEMPVTVICLNEEVESEHEAFMAAYTEAVHRINENPETYRELMNKTCRIPKPLQPDFPVYTFPEPRLPTQQNVWQVQQWALTRGMLKGFLAYPKVVMQ